MFFSSFAGFKYVISFGVGQSVLKISNISLPLFDVMIETKMTGHLVLYWAEYMRKHCIAWLHATTQSYNFRTPRRAWDGTYMTIFRATCKFYVSVPNMPPTAWKVSDASTQRHWSKTYDESFRLPLKSRWLLYCCSIYWTKLSWDSIGVAFEPIGTRCFNALVHPCHFSSSNQTVAFRHPLHSVGALHRPACPPLHNLDMGEGFFWHTPIARHCYPCFTMLKKRRKLKIVSKTWLDSLKSKK